MPTPGEPEELETDGKGPEGLVSRAFGDINWRMTQKLVSKGRYR